MTKELVETADRLGFMKASGFSMNPQGAAWWFQAADASLFQVETSSDLSSWQVAGTFEGGGTPTRLSLPIPGFSSSEVIEGDAADYVLAEGPPVAAIYGFDTLRVGSVSSSGGRRRRASGTSRAGGLRAPVGLEYHATKAAGPGERQQSQATA